MEKGGREGLTEGNDDRPSAWGMMKRESPLLDQMMIAFPGVPWMMTERPRRGPDEDRFSRRAAGDDRPSWRGADDDRPPRRSGDEDRGSWASRR